MKFLSIDWLEVVIMLMLIAGVSVAALITLWKAKAQYGRVR